MGLFRRMKEKKQIQFNVILKRNIKGTIKAFKILLAYKCTTIICVTHEEYEYQYYYHMQNTHFHRISFKWGKSFLLNGINKQKYTSMASSNSSK